MQRRLNRILARLILFLSRPESKYTKSSSLSVSSPTGLSRSINHHLVAVESMVLKSMCSILYRGVRVAITALSVGLFTEIIER